VSSPARKSSTVSGGKDGFVDTEHEQSLVLSEIASVDINFRFARIWQKLLI
jgi:hypothetical protein